MIWLRRILAIPLIFLFVLVFVLGLVLCHLSGTVGSAGFYNGQMHKAHVYDWIYDNLTPTLLAEAETDADSSSGSPFDTPEIRKDVVGVAETTFPREWLEQTFEGATKQVIPYVVGDKNSFTITIDVQDRIDPMAEGIKGVVDKHKQEIYDYVTDELIVPAVTESLGTNTTLSYGIALTDDEVSAAIKAAMTQDWTITQFKSMVDAIADYLKGDSTSLDLTVNLTSIKAAAAASLSTLAETKLQTAFASITATCSETQFLAQITPNRLPTCKPAGYTYGQFKQALETKLGMTIPEAVNQAVTNKVTDPWHFNDAEMKDALGEDLAGALDSAREFIVDKHGQVTDEELREKDNGSNDSEEEGFDQARGVIHTVKMLIWVFWIVAILLLVGIGFLCGRNWKSRLLWPLCVLFVTSLIFVIIVAVASAAAPIDERIVERPEGGDATQVGILMADKGDEIVHNAINTFVGGLEVKLVLFIVFSGLAIAGVIAWMIVDRRRRQRLTQNDPQSPPA